MAFQVQLSVISPSLAATAGHRTSLNLTHWPGGILGREWRPSAAGGPGMGARNVGCCA
jgi:hypothetical protein